MARNNSSPVSYRLPKNPIRSADEAERLVEAAESAGVDVSRFARKAIFDAVERELHTGNDR